MAGLLAGSVWAGLSAGWLLVRPWAGCVRSRVRWVSGGLRVEWVSMGFWVESMPLRLWVGWSRRLGWGCSGRRLLLCR